MPDVFADTSGWANFLLRDEPHHTIAKTILSRCRSERSRVLTTNYVLAELTGLLTSPVRMPRARQIDIFNAIRTSAWLEIKHVDLELDREAWNLFEGRPDKNWTLVDCSSFVLMEQRGIREALTSDRHFEQAGFLRLLV